MDKARLAYMTTLAVGAGSAVIFVWLWWSRKQKHRPPSKWRKVGELSDLVIFPVKSFGPIRENSLECTVLGLRLGWIRDRTLMVIDLDAKFVTARQYPKMVQISPSVAGSVLTLQAPGTMSISIDLAKLGGKNFRASYRGEGIVARDCGEEIARWLSSFLLHEDTGLRLVYYPLERPSGREVRENNRVYPFIESADTGAYPDATSYSLMNEASITDLNTRLDDPVTPQNFRMNFVVKGAKPLEEDYWKWIKIGQVTFRNVKPCTRCIFTTINPETGTKHPKFQPLMTLRKYRIFNDPTLEDSPVMGIHLGLRGPNGTVHLGDSVYVGVSEEEDTPLTSSR